MKSKESAAGGLPAHVAKKAFGRKGCWKSPVWLAVRVKEKDCRTDFNFKALVKDVESGVVSLLDIVGKAVCSIRMG